MFGSNIRPLWLLLLSPPVSAASVGLLRGGRGGVGLTLGREIEAEPDLGVLENFDDATAAPPAAARPAPPATAAEIPVSPNEVGYTPSFSEELFSPSCAGHRPLISTTGADGKSFLGHFCLHSDLIRWYSFFAVSSRLSASMFEIRLTPAFPIIPFLIRERQYSMAFQPL